MCDHGDTVVLNILIPKSISRTGWARMKLIDVDRCIAPIVKALNDGGITTIACCCGHGKLRGNILLMDGRVINIFPNRESWQKNAKKHGVEI